MEKKEKKETSIISAILMLVLFIAVAIGYAVSEADFLFSSKPVAITEKLLEDGKIKKGEYSSVTIDCENVAVS